ncbi:MAG: hypothetical protein JWR37_1247 [Mycobacterium sp.]|nr:hypothetical protein [Mycobacterium sp.]
MASSSAGPMYSVNLLVAEKRFYLRCDRYIDRPSRHFGQYLS